MSSAIILFKKWRAKTTKLQDTLSSGLLPKVPYQAAIALAIASLKQASIGWSTHLSINAIASRWNQIL